MKIEMETRANIGDLVEVEASFLRGRFSRKNTFHLITSMRVIIDPGLEPVVEYGVGDCEYFREEGLVRVIENMYKDLTNEKQEPYIYENN